MASALRTTVVSIALIRLVRRARTDTGVEHFNTGFQGPTEAIPFDTRVPLGKSIKDGMLLSANG